MVTKVTPRNSCPANQKLWASFLQVSLLLELKVKNVENATVPTDGIPT